MPMPMELEEWLKRKSAYFASTLSSKPSPAKQKKNENDKSLCYLYFITIKANNFPTKQTTGPDILTN
jgi:hypothetical protein